MEMRVKWLRFAGGGKANQVGGWRCLGVVGSCGYKGVAIGHLVVGEPIGRSIGQQSVGWSVARSGGQSVDRSVDAQVGGPACGRGGGASLVSGWVKAEAELRLTEVT